MRHLSKPFVAAASVLALCAPVWAQSAPGNFTYSAAKLTYRNNGVRLDGAPGKPARVKSPQLQVTANAIAFDLAANSVSQVRANDNVALKVDIKPSSGQGDAVHIESNSDNAVLTTASRTLVLTGNLSGFYRIGNGPQTKLSGSRATFNYSGDNLNALIESGANSQVELNLPAESGKTDAIGPVTLRADSLRVDEKNNAAYFSGNARAFSSGGANQLDVTAPSFTVQRAADGTIGLLTTNGKTVTKLDVPPDVAPIEAGANSVGKPTHLEVISDKAVVNRANSTGVFDGNVTGFYTLQNGSAPGQKFNFKGERATVTYDAKAAQSGDGLSVVVTGAPVDIEVPSFNLNF